MHATLRCERMTMFIASWEQQAARNCLDVAVAIRSKGVVEVPGELMLQQSDLIDHLRAIAFDVLGWQALEIRVRPQVERSTLIVQEQAQCQSTISSTLPRRRWRTPSATKRCRRQRWSQRVWSASTR